VPQHPFEKLYKDTATTLTIEKIDTLEVKETDTVVAWIKEEYEASGSPDLREPTVQFDLFENQGASITRLAHAAQDKLKEIDPEYKVEETERLAALLLGASLIRRASQMATPPISSNPAGEAAATKRGWKTLEDAIKQLKVYEDKLVRKGTAVLRKQKDLRAAWEQDEDDGSFLDAAGDVQRRLDFAAQPAYKALFANTKVNAELLGEGSELYVDAMAFFRGREGRDIPKTRLTLARDQAFTLLLIALDDLRPLLLDAYENNEEAQGKLEGNFWKRLAKLSKPRKLRKKDEAKK
jgi:hypothetical protein